MTDAENVREGVCVSLVDWERDPVGERVTVWELLCVDDEVRACEADCVTLPVCVVEGVAACEGDCVKLESCVELMD